MGMIELISLHVDEGRTMEVGKRRVELLGVMQTASQVCCLFFAD